MTIEDFRNLNDNQKIQMIFDADKIAEKIDNESNYQLFRIESFYVETKTSLFGTFKRTFVAYSLKDLPADYAGEVMSIPIVSSNFKKSHPANDKSEHKIKRLFL